MLRIFGEKLLNFYENLSDYLHSKVLAADFQQKLVPQIYNERFYIIYATNEAFAAPNFHHIPRRDLTNPQIEFHKIERTIV